MLTVGAGFALLDHGHIIAQWNRDASEIVCKRVRQGDAPLVYQIGRLFTLTD
jgi:hypothetical protein